jgi:hypothetical protein
MEQRSQIRRGWDNRVGRGLERCGQGRKHPLADRLQGLPTVNLYADPGVPVANKGDDLGVGQPFHPAEIALG